MWMKTGICEHWHCGDRLWHAGLSEDGTKCFVAEAEDNAYIIWDIAKNEVIWRDDEVDSPTDGASLDELLSKDGRVTIPTGTAAGRYRLFGLEHHHEKTCTALLDQRLVVVLEKNMLHIERNTTGEMMYAYSFASNSGDWAYASLSDNDGTIAVLEPYYVTFFQRSRHRTIHAG